MTRIDELRLRALEMAVGSWPGTNVNNTAPDAETIVTRAGDFFNFLLGREGS